MAFIRHRQPAVTNVFIHNANNVYLCGRGKHGHLPDPGGDDAAFDALTYDPSTYEMLGVKTGTGDLTTTHPNTLYAPDFEGVQRAFGVNKPVWAGGRVVNNYLRSTDNPTFFTASSWSTSQATAVYGAPDPIGGNTACTLTTTGNNANVRGIVYGDGIDTASLNGATLRGSVWLRRRTGTGDIIMYAGGSWDGTVVGTVTNEWQRFQQPNLGTHSGTTATYLRIQLAVAGDEVDYWQPQCEIVDGQTDTNAGEYVENTDLADAGSLTATKVFANANGNTVTDNVVTEAVGAPLAEVPRITTGYTDDLGTIPATDITYVFDSANSADTTSAWFMNLEATALQSILATFIQTGAGSIAVADGTSTVSAGWSAGLHKVGIAYGDGQMNINVDGSWGVDGAYDGTMLDGALDLFRTTTDVVEMSELQRYDAVDYDAAKTIVEGLMA